MAKAVTIKVKLVSSADTGFYYVAKKNSLLCAPSAKPVTRSPASPVELLDQVLPPSVDAYTPRAFGPASTRFDAPGSVPTANTSVKTS